MRAEVAGAPCEFDHTLMTTSILPISAMAVRVRAIGVAWNIVTELTPAMLILSSNMSESA